MRVQTLQYLEETRKTMTNHHGWTRSVVKPPALIIYECEHSKIIRTKKGHFLYGQHEFPTLHAAKEFAEQTVRNAEPPFVAANRMLNALVTKPAYQGMKPHPLQYEGVAAYPEEITLEQQEKDIHDALKSGK